MVEILYLRKKKKQFTSLFKNKITTKNEVSPVIKKKRIMFFIYHELPLQVCLAINIITLINSFQDK